MNIDFVFLQALQQAKNDQAKPTQPSENMLSFKIRHALLVGIRQNFRWLILLKHLLHRKIKKTYSAGCRLEQHPKTFFIRVKSGNWLYTPLRRSISPLV